MKEAEKWEGNIKETIKKMRSREENAENRKNEKKGKENTTRKESKKKRI